MPATTVLFTKMSTLTLEHKQLPLVPVVSFHVVPVSWPPTEKAGNRGHRDPSLLPRDMSWSQLGLYKACLWPLRGRKCRQGFLLDLSRS